MFRSSRLRALFFLIALLAAWQPLPLAAWENLVLSKAPAPPRPAPLTSATLFADATVHRIAFGSCFKGQRQGASVWQTIDGLEPQLFLFAGDTLYPDRHDSDKALPNLRAAYADLAANEPFATMRSHTAVLPVWDDHDFGVNDGGADFAWREQSERLFESAWIAEASDERRQRPGVYFSRRYGDAGKQVQIIVLDTRFFRSPLQPTDDYGARGRERYVPDDNPRKTMLGEAQWRWLQNVLSEPADLRIIVSTVQVIADGHGWEGWRQLPGERDRLFALLREQDDTAMLILSGDRHVAGFYERDIGRAAPLIEFTSSALNNPISFPNRNNTLAEAGPYRLGALYGEPNFGSINIDWKGGLVELNLHAASGQVVRQMLVSLIN